MSMIGIKSRRFKVYETMTRYVHELRMSPWVDPKISHWNGTADLKDVSDIGSKPPTDRL
jgi:hypothetical protein